MTIEIRKTAVGDIGVLLPMIAELYAHEQIPYDEAVQRPAVEALLADDNLGFICVIQVDGAPSGYLIATFGFDIEFGGRQATVTDVYVRPEFRRRGAAAAALRFAEQACRAQGARALELQVSDGNTPASGSYEKAGFAASRRFVMHKRLEAPRE